MVYKKKEQKVTKVQIPRDVKPQTLIDLAEYMKDRPYVTEEYERKDGWNSLIPVTRHTG